MTATLDQQIAAVRREIAMRTNVYRGRVADGKMRQAEADHELAAMKAVLSTLMAVKRLRATMAEHQFVMYGATMCLCGLRAPGDDATASFQAWLDHVFERSKAEAEAPAK